jgi:predicted DCC family thiol-disulfide oxidoreductase YuxK
MHAYHDAFGHRRLSQEFAMPEDHSIPDIKRELSTVYFDGACSLCQAEIGYYRRCDEAGAICFVDVSKTGAALSDGLTQRDAMVRFHVRAADGRMLSGAAAFAEVWARLPKWRWAARVAALPGVLPLLERGYRAFLPLRPYLSRLAGRILRRSH